MSRRYLGRPVALHPDQVVLRDHPDELVAKRNLERASFERPIPLQIGPLPVDEVERAKLGVQKVVTEREALRV
jgi:hypothetical protein